MPASGVVDEELIDLGAGGHGGLRAAAGDGDGRGGAGEPGSGPGVEALKQSDGKCAIEAVAGGHRVDGLHLEGGHPGGFELGDSNVAALVAALEDDAFQPA